MRWPITLLLSVALASKTPSLLPTEECPFLGPIFSSDFDLARTDAFAEAKAAFPAKIEALLAAEEISTSVSFIIDVYSTITNESIYTYTHEATTPLLNETITTGSIDDQTVFRIGSVSKLYTVYAILAHAGNLSIFDHAVTKYLPELAGNAGKDPITSLNWDDVTVGALASHMAGAGNFPLSIAACSEESPGCSVEDYLNILRDSKSPTQPVFQSSLYADNGFGILGRVLERLTGLKYNDAIQSVLSHTLGLNSTTSFSPSGESVNAIIIPGGPPNSAWDFDNQITAASGGLYSNAADFRATGIAILNSRLLSHAATRAWMKPRAHLSSLVSSIGAPWEINRLTLPVSSNSTRTRVSDLYTKGGGQPGYTAIFALSPDHSLGYSVLVAGATASSDRWTLRAAAGESFVAAAEHAAMENAARNFVGTFVDTNNATTNLTISVGEDHPGLGLESWFVDGLDWKPWTAEPALELPEGRGVTVRLYPTGLETSTAADFKRLKYRAVPELTPIAPRATIEGGKGLFDDGCRTWFSTAFFANPENGQVFDEFVFDVLNGTLVSISSAAAGKVLKRI